MEKEEYLELTTIVLEGLEAVVREHKRYSDRCTLEYSPYNNKQNMAYEHAALMRDALAIVLLSHGR